MLPKITYEYITEDNCKVKIFNVQLEGNNFISEMGFKSLLNDIKINLPQYIAKDFFNGLTIEIWNDLREDIPQSTSNYNNIGDKRFVGLTYIGQKLIRLKSLHYENKEEYIKYMSNLLSHELGHYFADYIGNFNRDTIMCKEYYNFRAKSQVTIITPNELIAEDFRLLFGANKSKDYERGEYLQANKVTSYKSFLELYKLCNDYLENIKTHKRIDSITFNYNNSFSIVFSLKSLNWWNFWECKWITINNEGIFELINYNWVKVKDI